MRPRCMPSPRSMPATTTQRRRRSRRGSRRDSAHESVRRRRARHWCARWGKHVVLLERSIGYAPSCSRSADALRSDAEENAGRAEEAAREEHADPLRITGPPPPPISEREGGAGGCQPSENDEQRGDARGEPSASAATDIADARRRLRSARVVHGSAVVTARLARGGGSLPGTRQGKDRDDQERAQPTCKSHRSTTHQNQRSHGPDRRRRDPQTPCFERVTPCGVPRRGGSVWPRVPDRRRAGSRWRRPPAR